MAMNERHRRRVEGYVHKMRAAVEDYEAAQKVLERINADYEAQLDAANGRIVDWAWRHKTDPKREKATGDANGARLRALLYAAVIQAESSQGIVA